MGKQIPQSDFIFLIKKLNGKFEDGECEQQEKCRRGLGQKDELGRNIATHTHINKKRDTKYAMRKLSKTITGLKYRTINIIKLGKKNEKKSTLL